MCVFFLVSGVVYFPAKDAIIVPYCYFATSILERSSKCIKKLYSRKCEGKKLSKYFILVFTKSVDSNFCTF